MSEPNDALMYSFEFEKWPVVAFRLNWDLMLTAVDGVKLDRPKLFRRPWVVLNADASHHMLTDETFRRLYFPRNAGTKRYLASLNLLPEQESGGDG